MRWTRLGRTWVDADAIAAGAPAEDDSFFEVLRLLLNNGRVVDLFDPGGQMATAFKRIPQVASDELSQAANDELSRLLVWEVAQAPVPQPPAQPDAMPHGGRPVGRRIKSTNAIFHKVGGKGESISTSYEYEPDPARTRLRRNRLYVNRDANGIALGATVEYDYDPGPLEVPQI